MQWMNKRDEEGFKPMDRIMAEGLAELREAILRTEMHDERHHDSGTNPLHFAAAKGLTEAALAMLNDGFRPNSRDDLGETALHTAVRHNRLFTVQALLKHCRPNLPNNQGLTALHWAVMVDNTDIVKCLLAVGADPDASNVLLDALSPRLIAKILHRGEILELFEKCHRTVAA